MRYHVVIPNKMLKITKSYVVYPRTCQGLIVFHWSPRLKQMPIKKIAPKTCVLHINCLQLRISSNNIGLLPPTEDCTKENYFGILVTCFKFPQMSESDVCSRMMWHVTKYIPRVQYVLPYFIHYMLCHLLYRIYPLCSWLSLVLTEWIHRVSHAYSTFGVLTNQAIRDNRALKIRA